VGKIAADKNIIRDRNKTALGALKILKTRSATPEPTAAPIRSDA
jgi:hypothetical protein